MRKRFFKDLENDNKVSSLFVGPDLSKMRRKGANAAAAAATA